jgi:hypothetical protein
MSLTATIAAPWFITSQSLRSVVHGSEKARSPSAKRSLNFLEVTSLRKFLAGEHSELVGYRGGVETLSLQFREGD